MRSIALLAAYIWVLLFPAGAMAEGVVPANLQAVLFKKLFAYDKALQGKMPKVLIVESGHEPIGSSEITQAFQGAGITAVAIKASELESHAEESSVVYLSHATDSILDTCMRKKMLSISPRANLAQEGKVAVALGVKSDGRPEIVIHLPRTKREGHEFPAPLLKLATVIQ